MEIDKLKLYFGDPYPITDGLTIYQPSIYDILKFGERKFYSTVNVLIANSTMYRVFLWDNGSDWNKISDFQLFLMFSPYLKKEKTRLIFKDVDFSTFKPMKRNYPDGRSEVILISPDRKIELNEEKHTEMVACLRDMFNIHPKVEKAKGKTTKLWMIEEEKNAMKAKEKDTKMSDESVLQPLISFCLNHPGFKYKKDDLRNMGIVEFMDSVSRLQIYESTSSLMHGMYSGMIDVSKIDKSEFDFTRNIK